MVLDIADHIGDHVRHQSIELNNKSDTQSESKSETKAETKAETKCIGSESASDADSEKFRWQMEQNLVSHQEGSFKDHGRGGDRLSSRPCPHCHIQLAKTWNCSQVSCAPGPGPGRQAASWRPTGAKRGPKKILARVPKT